MGWLAIGGTVLRAVTIAMGLVEDSKTEARGQDKTDLALNFAEQMLRVCGSATAEVQDPEVREALQEYAKAYVRVQNAIAKRRG